MQGLLRQALVGCARRRAAVFGPSRSTPLAMSVGAPPVRLLQSALDQYNMLDVGEGTEITQIKNFRPDGFTVNEIRLWGSILAFPAFTLLWDVKSMADVNKQSLAILPIIKPKISLLFIGTGKKHTILHPELRLWLKKEGIAVEEMSTPNALATFNIANQEGRRVAAALLSMEPYSRS